MRSLFFNSFHLLYKPILHTILYTMNKLVIRMLERFAPRHAAVDSIAFVAAPSFKNLTDSRRIKYVIGKIVKQYGGVLKSMKID